MISTIQQTIRRTVRSRESPAALDFFMGKCYIPDMKKQMEKKARPPEGAAADWTIPQNWPHYTAQDHATWDRLFARQSALLPGRASEAYLRSEEHTSELQSLKRKSYAVIRMKKNKQKK